MSRNNNILKEMLDILPLDIYIRDYNGTFIYLNDKLAKRYNKSSKELLGKNLLEDFKNINQGRLKKFVDIDREVIEKQRKIEKIEKGKDLEGKETLLNVVRIPLGKSKVLGILTDIKDEVLNNKKLNKWKIDYYLLKEKIKDIIEFSSEIHKLNPDNNKFWDDLLTIVMNIIPKADYGSTYINQNGFIKFISVRGHNKKNLNKLKIDSDKFFNPVRNNKVNIIKNIIEPSSNVSYYYEFKKNAKPIKESITFNLFVDDKLFGGVSIDIKEGSEHYFYESDKNILKVFLILIDYFYKSKQYFLMKDEFTKEVAVTLIKLLEFRDEYTEGHSQSVALLSKRIAEKMDLPEKIQEKIYWAGLLHDIGKISIPDKILNKAAKLTEEEYMIVKKHPCWSYESINKSEQLKDIANPILHHHERWDGNGYPDGLKGYDIPLISQIIAVADSWDAMVSKRIYKKALSKKEALKEIKKNRGTQFSPKVSDVFIKMVEHKEIENLDFLNNDKMFLKSQRKENEEIRKAYFEQLFEESKEAIAILNKDFKFLKVNKYFEKLFGFKKSELKGVKIIDAIIPPPKAAETQKFIKKLKNGETVNAKTYRQNKNREEIDVSLQAFPIKLNDGNIGYYVIYNDIREFKHMEEEYEKANDRYKALFQNDKVIMLIIDPKDGRIVDANPAAENFYGWSKSELKLMKISEINMLSEKEVKKEMENVKNNKKLFFDFRHQTANKEIKNVRVYSQSVKFLDKDYLYSIIININ